jgi:hypothetical protein
VIDGLGLHFQEGIAKRGLWRGLCISKGLALQQQDGGVGTHPGTGTGDIAYLSVRLLGLASMCSFLLLTWGCLAATTTRLSDLMGL